jgi:NADH:ubiquinone oxidoreductase subunit 3 (subunit A)
MDLEYSVILEFFFFSFFISLLLFSISFFIIYQQSNIEKVSAYECGFNPFGDARYKFEIHYYLVGILFIIFDLEITFLFPWLICFFDLNIIGIYSMFIFLVILTFGFIFELVIGVLDWN